MTAPPNKRLLDWPQLQPKIPYSRVHIGRLERAGEFPRRVRVGLNRIAWLESEIDEWIASRERVELSPPRRPAEALPEPAPRKRGRPRKSHNGGNHHPASR